MSIRLTGMASGLDTESMITDLMSAYNKTKHKKVSTMTKYSWKMEAWSSLNKKVNSFYSKALSNMRFSTTYSSKKTSVSDSTKASVIASNSAITGTQTLAIKQLAQSGYLTGGKLIAKDADGKAVKATESSTLADIGYTGDSTSFEVNGKKISVNKDTKLSEVVTKLQNAGVNANFDAANQRIFVSAKDGGESGDFSILANDTNGIKALANLGLYTGVSKSAAKANKVYADYYNPSTGTLNAKAADAIQKLAEEKTLGYKNKANAAKDILDENEYYKSAIEDVDPDEDLYAKAGEILAARTATNNAALESTTAELDSVNATLARIKELEDKDDRTAEEETELNGYDKADLESRKTTLEADKESQTKEQTGLKEATEALNAYNDNTEKSKAANTVAEADAEILKKAKAAYTAANVSSDSELETYLANSASSTAVRLDGQDAVIYLNGAEFTSTKNSFEINGLTITATATTGLSEEGKANVAAGKAATADDYNTITLSTNIDTDGIYKTIKNFLKEYNDLIKEMDKAYSADSASKFDVLSDEEKDAMSDTEIEAWEKKIKDSLLRRDSDLDGLISTFKNAMGNSYVIDGKQYSLATFGIETLSYFLSGDNEKGVYHIAGDPDDSDTSSSEDKLRAAIASDPDAVQEFFMKLSTDMHSTLMKKASATTMSSFGSFYNDKEMKTQYSTYQTALSDYEKKLATIEEKYYKQFSKMETALSKLQSSTSSLSSLLGN